MSVSHGLPCLTTEVNKTKQTDCLWIRHHVPSVSEDILLN